MAGRFAAFVPPARGALERFVEPEIQLSASVGLLPDAADLATAKLTVDHALLPIVLELQPISVQFQRCDLHVAGLQIVIRIGTASRPAELPIPFEKRVRRRDCRPGNFQPLDGIRGV